MKIKKEHIDCISDDLLNESTTENEEMLKEWSAQHPDHERIYKIISSIRVNPEVTEQGRAVSEQIFRQVNHRIDLYMRRKKWLRLAGMVASFLILLSISNYLSYQKGYEQVNNQILHIENPLGLKTSLTLPDGTCVTLNAGTTLSYPTIFTGKQREVTITGEAYFEVKKDMEHPFIVKTNELNVKVLGTSFNVKAYEEENTVDVTLIKGKVGVSLLSDSQLFLISPGEQISYNKSEQTLRTRQVDVNHYTGWVNGMFYFNKVSFEEIARQLERKFNVHINIESNDLRNIVFTGDFVRGENLDQILRVMTFDKRIRYQIEGDMVWISEK